MESLQCDFDWPVVERGLVEHIRGFLAVAVGSPELLEERYPEFENPEIPIERALKVVISQGSNMPEELQWGETTVLLAKTILPWIDYLRSGGYHPVPLLALHNFLEETAVPSVSGEVATMVARVEIDYARDVLIGAISDRGFGT